MATRITSSTALPIRRAERGIPRQWVAAAAGFVLLAVLSLLYLSQASAVSTLGYDIKSLEHQKQQAQAKNEQLRLQIAHLSSLDRIEQEASSRLGMTAPTEVVYLTDVPSANTVAITSKASDAGTSQTLAVTQASMIPEGDWLDGIVDWLPFQQRPLCDQGDTSESSPTSSD